MTGVMTDERMKANPVMICAAGEDGAFAYFDPAWLRFAGRALEEERGLGWTSRIHPDDRAPFLAAYRDAFARRRPLQTELRLERADRRYRRVSWTGAPLPPGAGLQYVGSCVDLTTIQSCVALYADLSPGAFYTAVVQPDGALELPLLSDAASRFFGQPSADLQADPSKALAAIHPDDRQRVVDQLAQAMRSRERLVLELRVVDQGEVRWLRTEAATRARPDGAAIWSGIIVDVTAHKEFEVALLDSRRHYQSVLRTSIDGYWTVDREGRFLEVNDAYAQLIGYSQEELRRMAIRDVEALEDPEATALHLEKVMRDGSDRFQTRHRRKDGQLVDIEVSCVYVPEGGGRFIVFLRDVTERTRVEAERAELLQRAQHARALAEQANRTKDEFLATLSHELRTPLSTILSWAHLIRDGQLSPEKIQRGAEMIERSARTQAQLVEDLLDVSRIAKGKLSVEKVEVDPIAPLFAAVEAIRPQAQAKEIELELDGVPVRGVVHGDPTRLQQVFWNLVSNAVKFTPRRGRVRLNVGEAERDGRGRTGPFACVRVQDTGQGIPPGMLTSIFDPFTQKDSSTTRAERGLGLGLAIVKNLVELHDGSVQAESAGEGTGATFTVWLPLRRERDARVPAEAQPAPPRRRDLARPLEGVRVLVVDDEADACEAMSEVLGQEGAEVQTARSATEALERVRTSRPDVLLSDIAMPAHDGYWLLRELQAEASANDREPPRVIALSAHTGPHDVERARAAGFQQHLAKPVEAGYLVAAIQDVLNARRALP